MYQITISVNKEHANWFEFICLHLGELVFPGVVYAAQEEEGRRYISLGCDESNASVLRAAVEQLLSRLILSEIKEEFISKNLRVPKLPEQSLRLLRRTLVAFDRETERKILGNVLFGERLYLDGFYNFKMSELRSRWREVCRLAEENSTYLTSEETMNELLRFLIGAVSPKASRVEIFKSGGTYRTLEQSEDGGSNEYSFESFDDLMCYLIDAAPQETVLMSGFEKGKVCEKLSYIFDARHNFT